MKKLLLISLLTCFSAAIFAAQVIPLPDLVRPDSIVIDSGRFYVTEGVTIFIYSLSDFKLIKKFGKRGEGPREFNAFVQVLPQQENLLINTLGKVTFYSKAGQFQKEIKTRSGFSGGFQKLGEKYVGAGFSNENNKFYATINFYDAGFKKIKEIYKWESFLQPNRSVNPVLVDFGKSYVFVSGNKVFIEKDKGIIDVYDDTGKQIYSIKHDYKRVKFTKNHEKRYIEFYKTNPMTRNAYENFKHLLNFPDYFPLIKSFLVDGGRVYVLTFKEEGDKREFYIFDVKGKFLKNLMLPFQSLNPTNALPFNIKSGKLYQLIENEDEEEWELHINEIK